MHVHFDHLLAALVAGGVVLALAFAQATGQEGAADAARFAASRSSADAIVVVLEQDLAEPLGCGVPAAPGARRCRGARGGGR